MNKILAVSVLLGVTVMMMGSILPVMAEHGPCRVGDPHCNGNGGSQAACKKVVEAIEKGDIDKKTAAKILEKVCKRR
jgi:hypothetical protein